MRLALPIHHCETHGPRYKNIVVLAIGGSSVWRLHEIILVGGALFDGLEVLVLRVLAAVVGHIPAISLDSSFLVVAVQVLNV